jgi:hypothetical protein
MGAQHTFAIMAYYKNGESFVNAQHLFGVTSKFITMIQYHHPTTLRHGWRTWFCISKKLSGRTRSVLIWDNFTTVREASERSTRCPACLHAASLGISYTSVEQILHEYLLFYPYKIHTMETWKWRGSRKLHQLLSLAFAASGGKRTHLHLHEWRGPLSLLRYVNKQNYSYLSDTNPLELHEEPLHNGNVTIRCTISFFQIMGPYLFENDNEVLWQ